MKRTTGLVLVFCLSVVAGALWPAQEARALPCHEDFCIYYSDASHTTVVGTKNTSCFGVHYMGQTSEFYECTTGFTCPWCENCNPPASPGCFP